MLVGRRHGRRLRSMGGLVGFKSFSLAWANATGGSVRSSSAPCLRRRSMGSAVASPQAFCTCAEFVVSGLTWWFSGVGCRRMVRRRCSFATQVPPIFGPFASLFSSSSRRYAISTRSSCPSRGRRRLRPACTALPMRTFLRGDRCYDKETSAAYTLLPLIPAP